MPESAAAVGDRRPWWLVGESKISHCRCSELYACRTAIDHFSPFYLQDYRLADEYKRRRMLQLQHSTYTLDVCSALHILSSTERKRAWSVLRLDIKYATLPSVRKLIPYAGLPSADASDMSSVWTSFSDDRRRTAELDL